MKTPIDDLIKQALEHYERLSRECCDWNSLVPKAIKEYGELEKLRHWRDEAAASAETGDKILDRIRTAVQEMLANKIMPEPVTLSDFLKVAEFFLYGKVLVSKEVFGGGAEKE
jgi:hypothetical protein